MDDITVIEGALVFDSCTDEVPELRAHHNDERHLIYEGGGIILDLLIKSVKNGQVLHVGGQVLPGERSGRTVSDLRVSMEHGKEQSHTHTNALGEFAFSAVPNSQFDLSIKLKDRRFTVRGLSGSAPRMWRVVPSMTLGAD
jgi:hypothetical protein